MSTAVAPHQPSQSIGSPRHQDRKALVSSDGKNALPELRNSNNALDKTKPLPTSLQSDFIPEDVLFALTQPPPVRDQLGPPTRTRNLNVSNVPARAPPSNLWSHKRRERFKHLTENTPCICGAGSDISFLYDVPLPEKKLERPDKLDKSFARKEALDKQRKPLELPDTLIPEEYHIIKNKGVMGIEFHEDKYSNQVEDHEKHLIVFPSMKPSSRFEVVQLKNTMDRMLDKAGVYDTDSEIRGPTQMHNLLELIKKEQNIYNTVFHEVIRQVSIECVDRGELLANLRQKYSDLLNKVPQQIKSLHEEVMAQRALDRRLTEELMRFKGTIGILTSELSAVKEHDKKVTKEAQQAQEDLKTALSEAQKNASLLAEYHDLYELQRKRLETSVHLLTEERELWSNAAYSLALKVTEEANLTTAKKLHVSEKSWAKLATHFTILLSDKDTELLTNLQTHVERWRDLVEEFNIILKTREEEMKVNISSLKGSIQKWMLEIRKICFDVDENASVSTMSTKEGHFQKPPDESTLRLFLEEMRNWEEVLGREAEKFGGDTLLNGQEKLTVIRQQMDGWTDNALKVFSRHRKEGAKNHPDQDGMMTLNEEVEELLRQFNNRITGENDYKEPEWIIKWRRFLYTWVAPHAIHLMHGLETWDLKIAASLNGTQPINDNEWVSLLNLMEEWMGGIDDAVQYVGSTQKEEDRIESKPHTRIDVMDTVRKVQKWATTASNAIDSEDGRLVEQVSTLHSQMVQWMVQMLLRLAPDKEGNSKEAADMVLLNSLTLGQLYSNVKMLFEQLEQFSTYVAQNSSEILFGISNLISIEDEYQNSRCCSGVVMDNTQARRDNMEDNAEHELKDLQRLRMECMDWIHTAKLLTSHLLEEPVESLFPSATSGEEPSKKSAPEKAAVAFHDKEKLKPSVPEAEAKTEAPSTQPAEADKKENPKDGVPPERETGEGEEQKKPAPVPPKQEKESSKEKLEVIGYDENTHTKTLKTSDSKPSAPATFIPDAPNTQKSYEALEAVESLQGQLMATEQRAQAAEDRAAEAESDLADANERIRELEKRLAKLEKQEEESTVGDKTPTKASATPTTPREEPAAKEKSPEKKEEKKRPESQASKASSKSSKSKKGK
ncbi:axonemal dynein light chain domain-containing protein 1-like isoform X2 [Saccostrea echinata]|uniref:axonemal dynein light chain domain-containing protein 1-like isoform X2 n=1 Tax=Saccostrea echinata TaxID=191078 RepID=UPI002A7F7FF2|nr:axonemal dynein light chain domain-containing protein 1-like isoform X2 [Saccostrea echinata]